MALSTTTFYLQQCIVKRYTRFVGNNFEKTTNKLEYFEKIPFLRNS